MDRLNSLLQLERLDLHSSTEDAKRVEGSEGQEAGNIPEHEIESLVLSDLGVFLDHLELEIFVKEEGQG